MPDVIDVVVQKSTMDCAVAALAMLSGKPYREVSEAALLLRPNLHRHGLWVREIRALGEAVGAPLCRVSEAETGLLILKQRKGPDGHVVVLFQDVVIDPATGQVWDQETFLHTHNWRVTGRLALLKERE